MTDTILLAANTDDAGKNITKAGKKAQEAAVAADQAPVVETQTSTEPANFSLNNFQVDLEHPSWDMILAGFFVVSVVLYGFALGRDRIVMIMLSVYMALAVVQALPDFVLNITIGNRLSFEITAFISICLVLFFLVSRSALLRTFGSNLSDGSWYQTIIFGILHVGLLVSVTMSFLPPQVLAHFSDLTLQIFTQEWTHFAWIAGPIVGMILFGSGNKEK